jgi:hypothetical protein
MALESGYLSFGTFVLLTLQLLSGVFQAKEHTLLFDMSPMLVSFLINLLFLLQF